MAARKPRYNDEQQVRGREIHQHNDACTAFGCTDIEGLPENWDWKPEDIAGKSPIDRAHEATRRVKSRAEEVMGSLKEHFNGGDEAPAAPAAAPVYRPSPAPRPAARPLLTDPGSGDTPSDRAVHTDRRTGLFGDSHSEMAGALDSHYGNVNQAGHRQISFSLENAARRLANHVSGAGTDGTHLMTWQRGEGGSSEMVEHTITGPQGEVIGGRRSTATKRGDYIRNPEYDTATHTDDSAARHNIKRQGPTAEHFINDVTDRIPAAAGTAGYHLTHKITLTREGEAAHKTRGSMTIDGGSSAGGGLRGTHREGQKDSRGVAPIVTVLPSHIQKIETHINPSVKAEQDRSVDKDFS